MGRKQGVPGKKRYKFSREETAAAKQLSRQEHVGVGDGMKAMCGALLLL
jgi:hypothetical protein